jgi:Cysteine-rich secretory protein family
VLFTHYLQLHIARFFPQKWNNSAAGTAQSWASTCPRSGHDPKRNGCGQNIYTSSGKPTSWTAALNNWNSEASKFNYGALDKNIGDDVGHYTQVVWAASITVGCGFAACKDSSGAFFKYVCNYCPP